MKHVRLQDLPVGGYEIGHVSIRAAGATITGPVRRENQDAILLGGMITQEPERLLRLSENLSFPMAKGSRSTRGSRRYQGRLKGSAALVVRQRWVQRLPLSFLSRKGCFCRTSEIAGSIVASGPTLRF